ncbi:39S ribosomal protein L38, mitochondrial [Homalodisca vitripennis]|nr:39S ribosomal protein L38, mitochondrial [Homalodisca vitripennis]
MIRSIHHLRQSSFHSDQIVSLSVFESQLTHLLVLVDIGNITELIKMIRSIHHLRQSSFHSDQIVSLSNIGNITELIKMIRSIHHLRQSSFHCDQIVSLSSHGHKLIYGQWPNEQQWCATSYRSLLYTRIFSCEGIRSDGTWACWGIRDVGTITRDQGSGVAGMIGSGEVITTSGPLSRLNPPICTSASFSCVTNLKGIIRSAKKQRVNSYEWFFNFDIQLRSLTSEDDRPIYQTLKELFGGKLKSRLLSQPELVIVPLGPAAAVDMKNRTFKTYDFYRNHQDQLTPTGLAFCQVDWDLSVSHFFHTVMDMDEPVYEYDFNPPYHPKQKMFPIRQPFNL